jgi:hypothetical protein
MILKDTDQMIIIKTSKNLNLIFPVEQKNVNFGQLKKKNINRDELFHKINK